MPDSRYFPGIIIFKMLSIYFFQYPFPSSCDRYIIKLRRLRNSFFHAYCLDLCQWPNWESNSPFGQILSFLYCRFSLIGGNIISKITFITFEFFCVNSRLLFWLRLCCDGISVAKILILFKKRSHREVGEVGVTFYPALFLDRSRKLTVNFFLTIMFTIKVVMNERK